MQYKIPRFLWIFPGFLSCPALWGSERIVVTATRIPLDLDQSAVSASILDANDLKAAQTPKVSEVLRRLPGLSVSEGGGTAGVSIRGANSSHTLVMLDGVPLNDPMSPAKAFNFSSFSLLGVDRIEVLRGPQSVLYGSDAMGGVINIIAKKGSLAKPITQLEVQGGTAKNYSTQLESSGSSYALGAGVSGANTEDFGRNQMLNAHVQAENSSVPGLSARVYTRFTHGESKSTFAPETPFEFVDIGTEQLSLVGAKLAATSFSIWEPVLSMSYSQIERTNQHGARGVVESLEKTRFQGDRVLGEFQNTFAAWETSTWMLGLVSSWDAGLSADTHAHRAEQSVFVQNQYTTPAFFSVAGVRYDVGSAETFRWAPGYFVESLGLTARASVGSGFKAPSLYQLYSSYGNTALAPERSVAFDAGLEKTISSSKLGKVGLTYFRNDFHDLIDFDFSTLRYTNVGVARTQGLEAMFMAEVLGASFKSHYTYTLAKDLSSGLSLLRRPVHRAGIQAMTHPVLRLEAGFVVEHVGVREDINTLSASRTPERIKLSPYTTLDVLLAYTLSTSVKLTGKVANILNTSFEEIHGYPSPGRVFSVGGVFSL